MKIATVAELQAIPCLDNGERLVDLSTSGIPCEYRRADSHVASVLVRESVRDKLLRVQMDLGPDLRLLVVEGYRSFAYQEKYYLQALCTVLKTDPSLELDLLMEQAHQFVALSSVSGHPTGGAIDLTLTHHGQEVNMGGAIADFTNPSLLPTFSPHITGAQAKWRQILHDAMLKEGFAPFYGEWWHFSYGDREWAAFYKKKTALYSFTPI